MARKVCSAGIAGPYTYVIVDTADGVISSIMKEDEHITTTHTEIEFAERWTDRKLEQLIGRPYEAE